MTLTIFNKHIMEGPSKDLQQPTTMIAYWDKDLICRYANGAYLQWFDKSREEIVDKIHIRDLLGHLFDRNIKQINGALSGKAQVFDRTIESTNGPVKNTRAVYTPDIRDGIVLGFYVYVSDANPVAADAEHKIRTIQPSMANYPDKLLYEVEQELKASILLGFPGLVNLAKHHIVSESKLKRDFKKKHGKSIFAFYRHVQMELAENYIKDKKYTKSQLAMMLNFSNPSNFSTCYNKYIKENLAKEAPVQTGLQKSQLYNVFRNQLQVSMAILDKDLFFLEISDKWIRDGQSNGIELLGKSIIEVQHISDFLIRCLTKCLNGAHYEVEEYNLIDATPRWIRWTISPWYGNKDEIQGLLLITEDITRVKESDKDKEAEILGRVSEMAKIGTWAKNLIDGTAFYSKISQEIFEIPINVNPHKETKKSLAQLGLNDELFETVLGTLYKSEEPVDFEVDIVTILGNTKTIRVIGYPDFYDGICEKISGTFQEIKKQTLTNFIYK